MKLYFLHHSGFMLDDGCRCYIFDYYKDPKGLVKSAFDQGRELWFFVSHVHFDHYNEAIKEFSSPKTRYIVHEDVHMGSGFTVTTMVPGDKVVLPGLVGVDDPEVSIEMFGSTDCGGSFLVRVSGKTIFHAGDLNWWHWLGDSPDNLKEAKALAWTELGKLQGLQVDYAMFPVDNRLEEAMEWGLIEFLRRVTVNGLLVPMHLNGPVWQPSTYYGALFGQVPLWNVSSDGDSICVDQ